MADVLAAMLAALEKTEPEPLKGPDANNPFKAPPVRSERRGQRAAHRDPMGNQAVGNIRREERKQ